MVYEVHVLYVGYSGSCEEGMVANCSCTLIRGRKNIIVDTMTPWDKDRIIAALARYHLTPDDITLVVCTHGHSDHIGNNNLFLHAKHIVGYSVSYRDMYNTHPFEEGEPYIVDEDVKVVPTPGHTNADVTVLVRTVNLGIVAVVGDLFEKEEDIMNPALWKVAGGSENPKSQEKYRNEMLLLADHIIPGHGPIFAVTPLMRKEADQKLSSMALSGGRNNALDRKSHSERNWKNPPEIEDRSNSNSHRPSVWEGRLGPSNDWDRPREPVGKRPERGPSDRLPPERIPSERLPLERVPPERALPRREEPVPRVWLDREKPDRDPWEDRRRSLNDHPFSPPPLLDEEALMRIEHKRARNPSDSWEGRHPRPDFDPGERSWADRAPEARAPIPDRFRGERRPEPWDDGQAHELARDDRQRFSRTDKTEERLPSHEEKLRREDRPVRDNRPAKNERLPRDRSFGPPETKPRDVDVVSNRFGGGGKLKPKRWCRGRGGRRDGQATVGDRPVEEKEAVRAPRRDEGIRREGREPRRPAEDRVARVARIKEERPRREIRPREDFHDRVVRTKHNDIGGRNGADSRTMRFHT